jgi:MraZ protein
MFLNEFEHTLDDKSRAVLPAQHRRGVSEEALQDRLYLVPSDRDECLELYPRESWEKHIEELKSRRRFGDREWKEFLRDFYSSASEIQLDKQYRFGIPEASKIAAGIQRDVYFVGLGDYVEVWSKERWLARKKSRVGKRSTPAEGGEPST